MGGGSRAGGTAAHVGHVIICLFGLVGSAVKFDGNSYLKYLHGRDEDQQDFRLALSFKTFQEQGLLVSTSSSQDWGVLQVPLPPLRVSGGTRVNVTRTRQDKTCPLKKVGPKIMWSFILRPKLDRLAPQPIVLQAGVLISL